MVFRGNGWGRGGGFWGNHMVFRGDGGGGGFWWNHMVFRGNGGGR